MSLQQVSVKVGHNDPERNCRDKLAGLCDSHITGGEGRVVKVWEVNIEIGKGDTQDDMNELQKWIQFYSVFILCSFSLMNF